MLEWRSRRWNRLFATRSQQLRDQTGSSSCVEICSHTKFQGLNRRGSALTTSTGSRGGAGDGTGISRHGRLFRTTRARPDRIVFMCRDMLAYQVSGSESKGIGPNHLASIGSRGGAGDGTGFLRHGRDSRTTIAGPDRIVFSCRDMLAYQVSRPELKNIGPYHWAR